MESEMKDKAEYQSLRAEINMRLDKLYSNNYAIITLVLAAWTLIIGAYINCIKENVTSLCVILVLIPTLFAIIAAFLLGQWNEIFEGVSSLAAYIRVFYEMPSIFSESKDKFCWETYVAPTLFIKNKKIALANKTYIIISVVSILLSLGLGIHCIATVGMKWFSYVALALFIIGLAVWVIYFFKNFLFNPYQTVFPHIYNYIKIAVEKFDFPADQAKEYLTEHIFYISNLDEKISIKLTKQVDQIKIKEKNYKAIMDFLDKKIMGEN